jgi:hypothetical protein
MTTARGTLPMASQVRQVRSDGLLDAQVLASHINATVVDNVSRGPLAPGHDDPV